MGEVKLTPIREYKWDDDYSHLRMLTCKNHQTARYLTKNPFFRSLGVIRLPSDEGIQRSETGECKCPFSDLVVMEPETSSEASRMEEGDNMDDFEVGLADIDADPDSSEGGS